MRSSAPNAFATLMLASAAVLFGACGGCGDGDNNAAAGEFKILSEGDGPTNEEPLSYLTDGTSFVNQRLVDSTNVLIRGPFEVEGRDIHRVVIQPFRNFQLSAEVFLQEDDDGIWLVGSSARGMLPSGVLRVPAEVRKGMRWESSDTVDTHTFEVVARENQRDAFGEDSVYWVIEELQDGYEPIYRKYVEGWGQVRVSDNPAVEEVISYPRVVSLDSGSPAVKVPEFSMEGGSPELDLEPILTTNPEQLRLDIIRAVRSKDDQRTALDMVGFISSSDGEGFTGSAQALTYADGTVAPGSFAGFTESLLAPWSDPEYGGSYSGRYDRFGVHGNTLFTDNGLFRSTGDYFIFENDSGGVDGVQMYPEHGCPFAALSCVETVVEPGFPNGMNHPIWGGTRVQGNVLLGQNTAASLDAFGQLARGVGPSPFALWTSRVVDLDYGKYTLPSTFQGLVLEPVSTLTTVEGDLHYAVSPAGFIERFSISDDGVEREFVGRARLPDGHTLRAAVEGHDNSLVLVTHETETLKNFVWTATRPSPVDAPAPQSIHVEQQGFDARVCWPKTSEELDVEGWTLGGVPALDVVDLGGDCALVVRDLAARPLPPLDDRRNFVPGWGVLEGPVPGTGRKRALFDVAFDYVPRILNGVRSAWLSDGGVVFEWQTSPNDPGAATFTGRGGIASGRPPNAPYSTPIPGYAGFAGEGIWFAGAQGLKLGTDGGIQSVNGFSLASDNPVLFPFIAAANGPRTAHRALQQGGLLVDAHILETSEHQGLAILRPDGTFLEIEHPADGTPLVERSNGELCGLRSSGTDRWLYCATPTGEVRETSLAEVDGRSVDFAELAPGVTPLFEDRFAIVILNNERAAQVDFEQLQILSYEMPEGYRGRPNQAPFRTEGVHAGADGLLYASIWLNNVDHIYGAFTVDRFKPIDEFVKMEAFFEDPAEWADQEVSAVMVDEDFAYVFAYPTTYRIPRAVWSGATACDPTTADGLDADGDGFVADSSCGMDCDDTNAMVNPNATEICDGLDNDCDGRVDEAGLTCWTDADGDGFAPAGAVAMTACVCEEGWTDREPIGSDVDCSDASADAFPGQTEYFDLGIPGGTAAGLFHDYDCDGVETERWPRGSCSHNGVDACDFQEGFIAVGGCGTFGDFLGCPEVGTCSEGGCVDSGALICVSGQTLRWKQLCR